MTGVRIEGDDAVIAKLDAGHLLGPPLRGFFDTLTTIAQAEVRTSDEMPVDTGRLRNSIAAKVASGALPAWGHVGTNVAYGRFVHEGTGAHWAPVGALTRWAKRHGVNPYALQRSIARRGTRARPFMTKGWEKVAPRVGGLVDRMAAEIGRRWAS